MSENLTNSTYLPRPEKSPWQIRDRSQTTKVVLASLLPAAVAVSVSIGFQVDGTTTLLLYFLPLQIIAAGFVGYQTYGRKGIADALLVIFTIFFSALVGVLLFSVLTSVVTEGFKALSPQFITQNNVYITSTTSLEYGGVGHAVLGTLIMVGLTTLVTIPLGIALAVYLTETQSKTKGFVRTLVQAMSGLPSVVAGLFVFAAFVTTGFTQYAGWLGSVALVPLMLPTVTRVAEEALRLVPVELRNGALALGAPSYRAFLQVTLPAAKSGIITATLLGIARIIGETAPLLLTVNYANNTVLNPLESMAALPTYIYQNLDSANDTSLQRAWGAALVVLIFVGLIFSAARIATKSKTAKKKASKHD